MRPPVPTTWSGWLANAAKGANDTMNNQAARAQRQTAERFLVVSIWFILTESCAKRTGDVADSCRQPHQGLA